MIDKKFKTLYPDMLTRDGFLNINSLINDNEADFFKGLIDDNGNFKFNGFETEDTNLFDEEYNSDYFNYIINESIDSRDIDNLGLLSKKRTSLFKSYFYYGNTEKKFKFKDKMIQLYIIEYKNSGSKDEYYKDLRDYLTKRFNKIEEDYKEIMKNFDRILYNGNSSYTSKDFYLDTFFFFLEKKGKTYYVYPVLFMLTKQKGVETQKYAQLGVLPDNKVYIVD